MADEQIQLTPILQAFADEVIETAQRELGAYRTVRKGGKSYRRRAVASGNLKNSLSYSIRLTGSVCNISFGASGKAKQYFRAVNDGRAKGSMPPVSPIVQWMKIKPVRVRRGGKFVKTTEKGLIRVAYAIAKSIQKDGIAPFPYYSDAIEKVLSAKGDEVRQQIENELQIALNQWQ